MLVEGLALDLAVMNLPSYVPPVDATQEFRAQTNTFSAEYGRSTGAVINFSIKSGTNQLHGSAYEYWRKPGSECQQLLSEPRRSAQGGCQSEPVRRLRGRPHQEGQDFLFRQLRRVYDSQFGDVHSHRSHRFTACR